jgi:DnaK suppressor protein
MQAADLDRLRSSLTALREDLRQQLTDLGADPDQASLEGGTLDFGFADSAQSTAERAKVLALAERLRDQLHDVERALRKMDDGRYGVCERCGEPIPPERLEALPYIRLCISCKQRESA